MTFVSVIVGELWRSGMQGKLLLGMLALLVCASIVALVMGFAPRSATVTRYFSGFVALVALAVLAATRTYVSANRAVVLASVLPDRMEHGLDPSVAAGRMAEALSNSQAGTLLASMAVLVSTLLLSAPLWRSDLRTVSRFVASIACALLSFAALFVAAYVWGGYVPFHYCEGQDRARCWLEHFERLRTITDTGSTVLLAFAAPALIVAIFFALRAGEDARVPGLGLFSTGVVMLALGGSAFAATRGMARDAYRLLATPRQGATCTDWTGTTPLPRAGSRCEPVEAPLVICSASGASIDGMPVTMAELETVLRNKRELWIQLNPRLPYPERVLLLVEEDSPRALFLPALVAARNARFVHVGILAEVPQPGVTTRTLGVVPRGGYCCATIFELDPGGRPIESFSTWGALHEAAAQASTLTVSLR